MARCEYISFIERRQVLAPGVYGPPKYDALRCPNEAVEGSKYCERCKTKKRPYKKPELRVYGDIRTMTETSTMGMHSDAAHMRSIHKTA